MGNSLVLSISIWRIKILLWFAAAGFWIICFTHSNRTILFCFWRMKRSCIDIFWIWANNLCSSSFLSPWGLGTSLSFFSSRVVRILWSCFLFSCEWFYSCVWNIFRQWNCILVSGLWSWKANSLKYFEAFFSSLKYNSRRISIFFCFTWNDSTTFTLIRSSIFWLKTVEHADWTLNLMMIWINSKTLTLSKSWEHNNFLIELSMKSGSWIFSDFSPSSGSIYKKNKYKWKLISWNRWWSESTTLFILIYVSRMDIIYLISALSLLTKISKYSMII